MNKKSDYRSKIRTFWSIMLLFILNSVISPERNIRADDSSSSSSSSSGESKQDQKSKTRWSLSEWLQTKDRMMLMDLWLVTHSPSPYEFYLSGEYTIRYPVPSPYAVQTGYRITAGAFASIFGLEAERDSLFSRWDLLFKLRLMGFHNQGTNLTLHGGARIQSDPVPFQSAIVGASLLLYLTKFFGIEGIYHYYFPGNSTATPYSFRGTQMEGNAFIDFNFLRVYGGYLRYTDDYENLIGYHLGARVFF